MRPGSRLNEERKKKSNLLVNLLSGKNGQGLLKKSMFIKVIKANINLESLNL